MSSIGNGTVTYVLALTLVLAEAGGASGVTLSAGNAAGAPGGTITVAISLENDVPVRAVQLRLTDTPNDLALVSGSARTTARSAALIADANEQADGSVIAVLLSTGAALIATGSGPVIELDFTIAPSASPGSTITLDLSEVAVADENRTPLSADLGDGGVSVVLPCSGDCDDSTTVTIDEILTLVNIALGNATVSACEQGDVNGDDQVSVDEILAAVNNALNGCP